MSLLRRLLLPLLLALGTTLAAAPFVGPGAPGFSASGDFLPVDEAFVTGASVASSPRVFWQTTRAITYTAGAWPFALEGAPEARLDTSLPSRSSEGRPLLRPRGGVLQRSLCGLQP